MNDDEPPRSVQRLNSELKEGEECFLRVLEGVRDYAILMLSPEGRILNWNTGAQAMKGYAAEEIIGQSFACFYTESDFAHSKAPQAIGDRRKEWSRLR